MRRGRTDMWDDATRREWNDVKRWAGLIVASVIIAAAWFVARSFTTSFVARFGITVGVAAIVGSASGWWQRRRSRVSRAAANEHGPA